jgi:hypothetical protein
MMILSSTSTKGFTVKNILHFDLNETKSAKILANQENICLVCQLPFGKEHPKYDVFAPADENHGFEPCMTQVTLNSPLGMHFIHIDCDLGMYLFDYSAELMQRAYAYVTKENN